MKRKLFALMLAVLLPIALLAGSGDVNGDGKINVADIVELVNYLNGNPSDKFIYAEADVNNDGNVNNDDVGALANITISNGKYIYFPQRVFHVINSPQRQLWYGYETNIDMADIGAFTSEVITSGCNWIRSTEYGLEYDLNNTGSIREAIVVVKNEKYDFQETIKIVSYPTSIAYQDYSNMLACEPAGDIIEIPIVGPVDDLPIKITKDTNGDESIEIAKYVHQIASVARNDTLFVRLNVDANASEEERLTDFYLFVGDCYSIEMHLMQPGCNAPSFAEQKEALRELYTSMNGDQWKNNNNWLSEKPITEWYGVNNNVFGNYVVTLNLTDNNLHGEMPESLSKLMPFCTKMGRTMGYDLGWAFDIKLNRIYGKIPEAVKKHPKWEILGWQIIQQTSSDSEMFDYDDFDLTIENGTLNYLVLEKNGPQSAYDIIHNHGLTLVHHAGIVVPDWSWFTGISDPQINQYLDYCNKGLGMVYITGRDRDNPFEPFADYAIKKQENGMPKTIHWLKDSIGNLAPNHVGTKYLFDKQGNLIQIFCGSCRSEDFCIPQIDSICRSRLGEPEEHEKFVSKYYTSTDYSKDGEVTKMQTATIGDGIDVVFVGEAYLDTEMGDGDVYEQTMQEAMESFFSEEPYKSLRNRFNIYAVKAVSPNDTYVYGVTQLAIGGNIEKAFEYAKKAVGDRDDRLMVGIICKPGAISERSCTFMFEGDGSFAAWMFEGVTSVLNHEMGGHGVAFLLDEYVEPNMENNSPDEDSKAWLDEIYERYGEGANVDWRSDPAEVKWAKFISDPRYSAEGIGVYEGSWLYGQGAYRPTENSMMRYNDCGFNAPSREAIYKRVMKLSEGSSWNYDYETFVSFDTPAREAYSKARAKARQTDDETQQKRIESRPPTIYKGTWRDAGKCEKVEYNKKFDR